MAAGATNASAFAIGQYTLGAILIARSERGICATSLGDDPETLAHELQDRLPQVELIGGDVAFERLVMHMVGLVETPASAAPSLPLDIRGPAFQERGWRTLQTFPAGDTASYADIAACIGQPKATRAVARACATNTLAVAIPCHHVIRRYGDLAGYHWGVGENANCCNGKPPLPANRYRKAERGLSASSPSIVNASGNKLRHSHSIINRLQNPHV